MSAGGEGGWGKYYRAAAQYAAPALEKGEPGARRKRFQGYLKAANELRQSYTAGYNNRAGELDEWPDSTFSKNGEEELVLFPSYARIRVELPTPDLLDRETSSSRPGSMIEGLEGSNPRFDGFPQEIAIVDVDVRGWLFTPHSGPLNRKNRSALWVARQLCGLPAQAPAQVAGEEGNPNEEEAEAARQAAAEIAGSGPLRPSTGLDGSNISRRSSWRAGEPAPAAMSQAEIKAAHEAFHQRLAPFTHRPIAQLMLTLFFFNDETSQSRTISTTDNGHFEARTPLSFIPTHVKVLVGEKLSTTEEIIIHAPEGVSLISDIDDTVKHSAITLGAREVFRNTFTAPLSSLSIPGVAEWYTALHDSPYNVDIHYASNSPWQLYPVLKNYFKETGLPPGSIHLRHYTGIMQALFEPAADRKKDTVERVIRDFPKRKWLLVGDSGEADLEVYTEIVERYPDRVLAVLIRDVTTPIVPTETGFFDSNEKAAGEPEPAPSAPHSSLGTATPQRMVAPPPLPRRRETDLIDLSDPPPIPTSRPRLASGASSASMASVSSHASSTASSTPPLPPRKPKRLQSPPIPVKPANLQRQSTSGSCIDLSEPQTRAYEGADYPPMSGSGSNNPRVMTTDATSKPPPPPPLPRRTNTASTISSVRSLSVPAQTAATDPVMSKKEDLWRKRWERAKYILEQKGVKLMSWRVGSDVKEETIRIVKWELRAGRGVPPPPPVKPRGSRRSES